MAFPDIQATKPRWDWREWVVVLAVFALTSMAGALWQKPVSFNLGRGWDGTAYYEVAAAFAAGRLPHTGAPFCYRLGTPFLAAVVSPGDLMRGFRAVNLAANVLLVPLLLWWLRDCGLRWPARALAAVLFITMWHGPIRFAVFYPVHVDPWAVVFLLAGLLLIGGQPRPVTGTRLALLCFISGVGVIFREIVLAAPLAALLADNPLALDRGALWGVRLVRPPRLAAALPLVCGLAGIALTHALATGNGGYSFVRTVGSWIYSKSLAMYVLGWFIAFGPVLALVLYRARDVASFLGRHQALLAYLVAFAVLGWIGGTDTERILYWSMPVVYVLVGLAVQDWGTLRGSVPLVVLLGLAQGLAQRLLWLIPDFPTDLPHRLPIHTPPGSQVPYFDLYSVHGDKLVEVIALAQYMALTGVIVVWLRWRDLKRQG
ncbi:hypothetical protein LLH23_22985 [bacterium]|nr:hypothetical protein [bacterium]